MTDFRDLRDSTFESVDLTGSTFRRAYLNSVTFQNIDMIGTKILDVDLVDVEITGEVRNVTINGVDASSSLMLMTLGAKNGDTVEVESDDQAALDAIAALVEQDLDA